MEANRLLEEIQQGLETYLETKRVAFPRFYFLSNEDLLDILAQTHDPHSVQPHLRKCFENIAQLEFNEDVIGSDPEVTSMISAEKEQVKLMKTVWTSGAVETWLSHVESSMRSTICNLLHLCIKAFTEMEREDWIFAFPAQCILVVEQIVWTHNVFAALEAIEVNFIQVN